MGDKADDIASIRLEMTRLGWSSHDKLDNNGWGSADGAWKFGYIIWFERWDWHGKKHGNKASFFAMTDDLRPEAILAATLAAAKTAMSAWDVFLDPDQLPYQVVEHSLKNGPRMFRHEFVLPTLTLP